MIRVSHLAKAALVALPATFLGACGMFEDRPAQTATVDVGARQLAQQNAARIERLEQERTYQRDLRK